MERTFREQKSTLEVRPIYHQRDDTSMGHIVASFLALRLEVDLQQRLEEREIKVSWPDLMFLLLNLLLSQYYFFLAVEHEFDRMKPISIICDPGTGGIPPGKPLPSKPHQSLGMAHAEVLRS